MMGIEYIMALAEDAGVRAQHMKLEPLVLDGESSFEDLRGIPNLGTYVPKGWEEVDRLFVDSSGWGQEGEPALTINQFYQRVHELGAEEERGFAIVEEGQFQIKVGVFQRVS